MMLAADKDALHARSGDATLFIDERGNRINGQWQDRRRRSSTTS